MTYDLLSRNFGERPLYIITKASMLAEFFFALAMLWREGLRAKPPPPRFNSQLRRVAGVG